MDRIYRINQHYWVYKGPNQWGHPNWPSNNYEFTWIHPIHCTWIRCLLNIIAETAGSNSTWRYPVCNYSDLQNDSFRMSIGTPWLNNSSPYLHCAVLGW